MNAVQDGHGSWEHQLFVPQDELEELDFFPNFGDDLIPLNKVFLASEYNKSPSTPGDVACGSNHKKYGLHEAILDRQHDGEFPYFHHQEHDQFFSSGYNIPAPTQGDFAWDGRISSSNHAIYGFCDGIDQDDRELEFPCSQYQEYEEERDKDDGNLLDKKYRSDYDDEEESGVSLAELSDDEFSFIL